MQKNVQNVAVAVDNVEIT